MRKTTPVLVALFCLTLTSLTKAQAQKQKKKWLHDSNYYEMYPDKLTGRVLVSEKYTQFTIPSSGNLDDVLYKANNKMHAGIGVTWHNYSVNATYGISSAKEKGKTKGLNLQFHLYPHKWAVDLLLVMPKGMYLSPKGYAASGAGSYYYRPDVKERLFGVAGYRVPNKEKFSYRAALVQNEWQKKSAGSPLYGGEIYYGIAEGDSALVPKQIESGFAQKGITEMRYISIGPGVGYAYTLVMDQHFFIMASLIGNAKVNIVTEEYGPSSSVKKTTFSPSAIYKAGIGYNSSTWSFCAGLMGNALLAKGKSTTKDYFLPAGAWRVSLAKKFDLKKKHPK